MGGSAKKKEMVQVMVEGEKVVGRAEDEGKKDYWLKKVGPTSFFSLIFGIFAPKFVELPRQLFGVFKFNCKETKERGNG